MRIVDFAKARNLENQAVTRYINRHREIFDGHISKEGRQIVLDEIALSVLEEKYPLPKPVQVLEDTAARKQLIEAQEMIIKLQQQLVEAAPKIAMAEHNQFLISQIQQENEELKSENEELKKLKAAAASQIEETKEELRISQQRAAELSEKLENETNRPLSLYERLTGKRREQQ